MKCCDCKCMRPVTYKRYNKDTKTVGCVTVQKCFGVAEAFEITNIYQDCVAYPEKYWNNTTTNKPQEVVVLPLNIGDEYYTKSLIFYDGIDETGEPISDIQCTVRKRVIKNKSDIYEYMMLHERGQAFLTEKEAENINLHV